MKDNLEGFFENLVEYQKRHIWLFLFGMFFITALFGFFAMNVEVDSTLDAQLLKTDDYLTYREVMSREFGQTDLVFIVIRQQSDTKSVSESIDMRDADVFHAIDELEMSLMQEPEIKSVTSVNTLLKARFGKLPQTDAEAKEYVHELGGSGRAFLSSDYSSTVMFASVDTPAKTEKKNDLEARIDKKVDEAPFPAGTEAIATGFPKLLNRIIALMINDSIKTLVFSIVFVFAVLIFFFRKVSLSLIAITPVILSTIWLAGAMAIIDLKLSIANATVAAMIIGLGVDYGIHVVNTFDNRVKDHAKKPVTSTMKLVGVALFMSFLTSFVGFSANMFASTEAITSQGLTLALGITFTYITTMLTVPPLLKLKINLMRHEHGESKWR